jgi:hypothetical protein
MNKLYTIGLTIITAGIFGTLGTIRGHNVAIREYAPIKEAFSRMTCRTKNPLENGRYVYEPVMFASHVKASEARIIVANLVCSFPLLPNKTNE